VTRDLYAVNSNFTIGINLLEIKSNGKFWGGSIRARPWKILPNFPAHTRTVYTSVVETRVRGSAMSVRQELPKQQNIIFKLNEIVEHELAGVVRYTHYSFMIFGYSRIPVVSWLRSAAT